MRILVAVFAGLVVVSGTVATLFWSDLRAERQVSAGLRTQLEEARAALAAVPAAPAVATLSQAPVDANVAVAAPVTPPAAASREAAAAMVADYAKKAKTLLDDPQYRKARLAQVRLDLKSRYASLPIELGLSDKEADALFDLLAEQQLRLEAESAARMADVAGPPDEATIAKLNKEMEAIQQQQKNALLALLGPARYEQFEEYEQTQPSRTRVNNLTTLLARSGRPLSNAQTRSLTAVIIAEQKRMEAEAKAFTDAGQSNPQSQAERQAETNRRILEKLPEFLDAQQIEAVRGRFQQRAAIDGANERVQQREREVLQQPAQ